MVVKRHPSTARASCVLRNPPPATATPATVGMPHIHDSIFLRTAFLATFCPTGPIFIFLTFCPAGPKILFFAPTQYLKKMIFRHNHRHNRAYCRHNQPFSGIICGIICRHNSAFHRHNPLRPILDPYSLLGCRRI